MPIDKLDGNWPPVLRDQLRDNYLEDFTFHVPGADKSPTSSLYAEASTFADGLLPLAAVAERVADATNVHTASAADLEADGAKWGIERFGPSKASGPVIVRVRSGGAAILAGTVLQHPKRGTTHKVSVGGVFNDLDNLAIESDLTGAATNLDPGTELEFLNPPPGVSRFVTVFENADGSGLTGGAPEESLEDYALRIEETRRNPPQAGNEQAVIDAVMKIRGYGFAYAFCYPAIRGPGTQGVAVIMRPSVPGASRIPNDAQRAYVEAVLKDKFQGDTSIFVVQVLNQNLRVSVQVTWRSASAGWANLAPWPLFYADPVRVDGAVARSAGALRLTTTSTIAAPTVGKVIGFYDGSTRTFRHKTIATVVQVVANKSYDLTFDMSSSDASDLTFVPATGAAASPWSDSLDDLVPPILVYGDKQGPGEQKSSFGDPGRRERRYPEPDPRRWPNRFENRVVDGIHALDVVSDATLVEPTSPSITTVGVPGTLSYLHRVTDIAVFPTP